MKNGSAFCSEDCAHAYTTLVPILPLPAEPDPPVRHCKARGGAERLIASIMTAGEPIDEPEPEPDRARDHQFRTALAWVTGTTGARWQ